MVFRTDRIEGVDGISYDIVVGSSAQVLTGKATHTVSDFVAAIAQSYRILILDGTHTLVRNEDITEQNVTIFSESSGTLIAVSTFTFTMSGNQAILECRFSGAATKGDVTLSGLSSRANLTGVSIQNVVATAGNVVNCFNASSGGGSIHLRRQYVELPNSANTLTVDDINRQLYITPTATRIIDLPSTDVRIGDTISIINLAASQKISIEASAGAVKMEFQDGFVVLMAKQGTPTTPAHWMIKDSGGGAKPSFNAYLGTTQTNITSADQVEIDNFTLDNNDNYNTTAWEFLPTVPGHYAVSGVLVWSVYTSGDDLVVYIYKNGTPYSVFRGEANASSTMSMILPYTIMYMNGTTDDIQVWALNATRNTSSIFADVDDSFFAGHWIGE